MSNTNRLKAGKAITYAALALLVIAAAGLVAYFTNGFTNDFKTFYIERDGTPYLNDTSELLLSPEAENRFDVKYTFGLLNSEMTGYSLKIVPNISNGNDFDFTVDGEVYSFGAESDLTSGFEITYYEDYFVINGDYTMQSVLERLYPESEVSFNAEDVDMSMDYFLLQIYSYNDEALISIAFHNHCPVTGVELDLTVLEF